MTPLSVEPAGWRKIFWGPLGLRSGWRIVLFLVCAVVLLVVHQLVATAVLGPQWFDQTGPRLLIFSGTYLFPAVLLSWVFMRFVDGAPLVELGFGGGVFRALGEGVGGALMGLVLIAASVALVPMLGGTVSLDWESLRLGALLGWSAVFLVAASWEEVIFRGYIFQWAGRGMGWVMATLVLSGGFGLAHGANPNVTPMGLLNIALAGVLLSLAYLATGRLWLAMGLHWGWNAAQALVFGIPVSGLVDDEGVLPVLMRSTFEGPQWVTGGRFGFEGSVVASVSLAVGSAALMPWVWKRLRAGASSDELGPGGSGEPGDDQGARPGTTLTT